MASEKRIKARKFGEFAEEMAANEYISRGYTVRERKWRLGKTEIDLIAQKENVIVIIEVKSRGMGGREALMAVNYDKRRRMVRAADAYLHRCQGFFEYRFDIVACSGTEEDFNLEIFENAFLATDLL